MGLGTGLLKTREPLPKGHDDCASPALRNRCQQLERFPPKTQAEIAVFLEKDQNSKSVGHPMENQSFCVDFVPRNRFDHVMIMFAAFGIPPLQCFESLLLRRGPLSHFMTGTPKDKSPISFSRGHFERSHVGSHFAFFHIGSGACPKW